MKIGVQTWGSDGDINPFIALAGGLSAAGHDVTLAIMSAERKDYERFAARLGFRLIPFGYIWTEEELIRIIRKMNATTNMFKQLDLVLDDMFEPGVDAMYEMALSLCADNEIVIGHFILHPLHAAAEKARKPYVTVTLNHGAIPTRHAAPAGLRSFGTWLNGMVWKVAVKILEGHILPSINRLRRREGLLPASSFRDIWESPLCNLIAVSPQFCEPKQDWSPNQHVCGFFRMPEAATSWEIPDGLARFLSDGPPPVYMTFGSMLRVEPDAERLTETTRLLVEAAKHADCRAIIQSRWDEVRGIPESPDIYRVEEAPHTKIFPHCAAVVHHGGAGTTQTATLCGCPSVVVAHITDQYFWGRELKRLGVAPNLLERRKMTSRKLGREIRQVLDSQKMGNRAKELAAALAAENGALNAVALIERMMPELYETSRTG